MFVLSLVCGGARERHAGRGIKGGGLPIREAARLMSGSDGGRGCGCFVGFDLLPPPMRAVCALVHHVE